MESHYEHISIDSVISRAKIQLRLVATSDFDDMLEIFIMEGLGSLGVLSQRVKKECHLDVDEGKAKLPKDFLQLIAMRADIESETNDPIENEVHHCGYVLYADTMFLDRCGCNGSGFSNTFQINKGWIHFNHHGKIRHTRLAYYGLNIDEDERPLIYSRYERALSNYAMWQYSLAFSEHFNINTQQTYESVWVNQKQMLRAQDVRFSFELEKREIANIVNALVINKTLTFTNP